MYVYTHTYNLWTPHNNMDAEPRRLLHWKKETRKQISSQRTAHLIQCVDISWNQSKDEQQSFGWIANYPNTSSENQAGTAF